MTYVSWIVRVALDEDRHDEPLDRTQEPVYPFLLVYRPWCQSSDDHPVEPGGFLGRESNLLEQWLEGSEQDTVHERIQRQVVYPAQIPPTCYCCAQPTVEGPVEATVPLRVFAQEDEGVLRVSHRSVENDILYPGIWYPLAKDVVSGTDEDSRWFPHVVYLEQFLGCIPHFRVPFEPLVHRPGVAVRAALLTETLDGIDGVVGPFDLSLIHSSPRLFGCPHRVCESSQGQEKARQERSPPA